MTLQEAMVRAVLFLTLFLCVSCRSDQPGKDSTQAATLTVDSIPVLVIAGTASDGDIVFETASGATRLSDGTVVIGDGLGQAVRFVDNEGRLVNSVGREGGGPGEFEHIEWLGQCGVDSVYVWDSRLARMTVVGATGDVQRTYRLPVDPSSAPAWLVSCSRQGTLVFIETPQHTSSAWDRYGARMFLADAGGVVTREFAEVPAYEGGPLGKVTSIAVTDDILYVGTKDSAFIDAYSIDGNDVAVLSVDVALRPPTMEHFERSVDAIVVGLGLVADREALKQIMLQRPMPEYLPPYASLLADPSGLLWVQLSLAGDAETRLRAIRSDGQVVGDVSLPRYMSVYEIGQDHILGAYDDDGGEPYLVMYRLRRTIPQS